MTKNKDTNISRSKYLIIAAIVTSLALLLLLYQIDRVWLKIASLEKTLKEQIVVMQNLQARNDFGFVASEERQSPAFRRALMAQKSNDYSQGDWLVRALTANLSTLTPLVSKDANASEIQSYVLESLLTRDPDSLEWQGLLANDWNISPGGLVIEFTLKSGVRFSDGHPLTAEDVVFSFELAMNEAINAPALRSYYEKISQVRAINSYKVRFDFREPYFKALELVGSIQILPKHFYGQYMDPEKSESFNQSKGLLLGSGPYQLENPLEWSPVDGKVLLVRNDNYWGEVPPSYDRMVWKVIQNNSARLTTFRNGEIDLYSSRPVEYAKLLKDKDLRQKSTHYEYMSSVVGYSYVGWNQKRKGKPTFFADKRVRQAMTYLSNRQGIIDEVFLGYAEIAVSPFNPRSQQHDKAHVKPYPFDIAKAKQLLAESGFADSDGDGVIEKDGKPFVIDMSYFESSEDTKRMVLMIKDDFARAGIKVVPSPKEWPVMLKNVTEKDFDAIVLGWSSGIETDIYQMFHSSQMKTNGDNFISYHNPDLDALIQRARLTVEETPRMKLWQQAERILHEDQPYTFIMRRKSLVFLDDRIKNISLSPMGLNHGLLPIETYVPKALQRYGAL